ncbi:olfactory receptor 6B1-like [Emydura macquarii macquarii]|uniref:olfactory receptor 6B1-like n=1 Tax=Emydura macquarii macquarii TaxID=1129001 RepID=UPI00352A69FB
MYFFLGNLSCLETCYISTILPRLLASLLRGDRIISFSRCFVQFYFFACLAGTECYLLCVMSYDRYLAICKPLHYSALMNGRFCLQLAGGSWISGFLANSITIFFMSRLTFCGPNEINHFFCDFSPVIRLSCSDSHLMKLLALILASVYTLPPFILLMSYVYIMITLLGIHSSIRRQKAFSTCSSHLIVVTIFYGTLTMVYVLPDANTLRDLHKWFSAFYTVLTPIANPLIYSLGNREVKNAIRKTLRRFKVSQEF